MPDASLYWNDDFIVAPNGDLAIADGVLLANQRIIRRLLTAVNGYIWNLGYGAGLPQRIGYTTRISDIQALVTANLYLESTVAKNPPAQVQVAASTAAPGAFVITIQYVESGSQAQRLLSFDTSNPSNVTSH